MSVRFSWFIALFKPSVSILCLVVLKVGYRSLQILLLNSGFLPSDLSGFASCNLGVCC